MIGRLFAPVFVGLLVSIAPRLSAQSTADSIPEIVVHPLCDSTAAGPSSFPGLLHAESDVGVVERLYRRTVRPGVLQDRRTRDELERNLRERGLFRELEVVPVSSNAAAADSLLLRDAWSLFAAPLETVGEDHRGLLLQERNLAGTGRRIEVGRDLLTEEGERVRTAVRYLDAEFLNSVVAVDLRAVISNPRLDLSLRAHRPFHTDHVPMVYGIELDFFDGEDSYHSGDPWNKGAAFVGDTVKAVAVKGIGWFGLADSEEDLFVGSAALHLDRYDADADPSDRHAFRNTIGLFAGLQSIRRVYSKFTHFDASGERFEPVGGAGGVSVGKYFNIADGDDALLYGGVNASQSLADTNNGTWFLNLGIEAGTGIRSRETELTMLKAGARGGWKAGPGTLAFISDLQVAWRWDRYLFSSHRESPVPLRGYDALALFGGNHLSSSVEYRVLPGVSIGPWSASMTLFHDMAGYWNLGSKFATTRFHHALGAGIRLGHAAGVSRPILRIDFPYNVDEGRLGRIEIGLQESFDLFGTLRYRPPGPLQPD